MNVKINRWKLRSKYSVGGTETNRAGGLEGAGGIWRTRLWQRSTHEGRVRRLSSPSGKERTRRQQARNTRIASSNRQEASGGERRSHVGWRQADTRVRGHTLGPSVHSGGAPPTPPEGASSGPSSWADVPPAALTLIHAFGRHVLPKPLPV